MAKSKRNTNNYDFFFLIVLVLSAFQYPLETSAMIGTCVSVIGPDDSRAISPPKKIPWVKIPHPKKTWT